MKLKLIILLIILTSISGGCEISKQMREEIIIPNGYEGGVVIFFDVADGTEPEYKNNTVVYRVPDDGILKLKTKATKKTSSTNYFYANSNNNVHLDYVDHWGTDRKSLETLNNEQITNGTFVFNDGGLGSINIGDGTIQYRSFLVGKPINKARMYDAMMENVFKFQRQRMQQVNK